MFSIAGGSWSSEKRQINREKLDLCEFKARQIVQLSSNVKFPDPEFRPSPFCNKPPGLVLKNARSRPIL
jgi:hypothetical protein